MGKQGPRIRDFIETKDGLIFASVSYHHPPDRYQAFLRYYPDEKGERRGYRKVASTEESFTFLERNFPGYLFGAGQQGVPRERASRILSPVERLKEITRRSRDGYERKVAALSKAFAEIGEEKKGITGSALPGLHTPTSDIDFVVYGRENFNRARELLQRAVSCEDIRPLNEREWRAAYEKRFGARGELGFEEFVAYEKRKRNRGVIGDTLFDILFVRDWGEIEDPPPGQRFERLGRARLSCTVTDASFSFDSPALYKVECGDPRVREVASFTHTYAGQALEGEEIEVSGALEKVMGGEEDYLRVVVGTTREARGEYIKVRAEENRIL